MNYTDITFKNKLYRLVWRNIGVPLLRFSPWFAIKWRVAVLKCWGADVSWEANVYSNVVIWSPRNLILGPRSTLSNGVVIYNVDMVKIGVNTTLSDNVYICTASKTTDMKKRKLKTSPVNIGDNVWLAAHVNVLPGVTIDDDVSVLFGVTLQESVSAASIVRPLKNYAIVEKN